MALKTVTGTLTRSDGTPVAQAVVTAQLSAQAVITGSQEVAPIYIQTKTAADGTFSLSLQANLDLTPTTTSYLVSLGSSFTCTAVVPQTVGPFELSNIMASPPAVSPPAALDSQVVHLALTETITGVKHSSAAWYADGGVIAGAAGVLSSGPHVGSLAVQSLTPLAPVTSVRDDFHRPDTAAGQLGNSIRMPAWRITGAAAAQVKITSQQCVCPNAGAPANVYLYQNFWATPYKLRAAVSWQPGPAGSTAVSPVTLISSVDSGLFVNSVHVVFEQSVCFVQKRIANASTTLATITYPGGALASDGTQYAVSVAYNGSAVTVLTPDGITTVVTDADFATLTGTYCTWEMGNGTGEAESRILSVSADLPVRWAPRSMRETILGDTPPLLYWPMDETDAAAPPNSNIPMDNAGQALYSGFLANAIDATRGAASLIVGDPSPAYLFGGGGTAYIVGPNVAAVQLTTGSMSFWINTTDNRSGDHGLFGKYNAWLLEMVSGVLKFRDFTGGLRDTGVFIADGITHHIGVSFVSGGASQTLVYVDGRLVLTTTSTVVNQATAVQAMAATNTWQAKGTAQHFALWNSVLTAAQFLAQYNAGRDAT